MGFGLRSALGLFEIFLSFLLAYNTTFLEDSFERNLCCVMAYQMGIIMKKLHLETAGYLVSGALVRDK
ncbi:hypothetical protein YC2023_037472 [Brassica napus]